MPQPVSLPLPRAVASTGCVSRTEKDGDPSYETDCHNLFLLLYRFVPEDPGTKAQDNQKKRRYLEALVEAWPQSGHVNAVEAFYRRREAHLAGSASAAEMTLRTDSRLIAGLGYDSPLEIGMTLHPLHGFPYLPGSTVKGLARAWATTVALPQGETTEADITAVFGHAPGAPTEKTARGSVTFFDALPRLDDTAVGGNPDETVLEVDVMTPHYGPYYTGSDDNPETHPLDALPGDWHQPTPVPFLTVAANVRFSFAMTAADSSRLALAKTWLTQALVHLGVGSKTRAGYGYFQPPEGVSQGASGPQEAAEDRGGASSGAGPSDKPASPSGSGFPASVDPVTEVTSTTGKIPARVVENKNRVKVELYIDGYDHPPSILEGVQPWKDYPVGSYLYVRVSHLASGRVRKVRPDGNLRVE